MIRPSLCRFLWREINAQRKRMVMMMIDDDNDIVMLQQFAYLTLFVCVQTFNFWSSMIGAGSISSLF